MTQVQAPPGAPATAQAGPPVQPVDQRRRGRIGPVSVGQIVVAEVGVVAVGAALDQPVWLIAVVATLAVLAVVAVFARRRGRWWYEALGLRRGLRYRSRRALAAVQGAGTGDPRLAALAPDLSITEVVDRGARFGLGRDERGWFLACVIVPAPDDPSDLVDASTIDRAVRVLAEFTGPLSVAQVVAHTVVSQTVPGGPAAAQRDVWVAARLSVPDARTEAVSRGGGVRGVHRTMAAVAGRLGKALTGAGLAYQALDGDELQAAVLTAAGLDLVAEPQVETWTGLAGGGWAQRCLELRPRSDVSLGTLADAVTATSAISHTLSVVVGGGGRAATAPLLRVAAVDSDVDALVEVIQDVARRHSTAPRQLDGRHGPGIYACAPTAAEGAATAGIPVRV
jgi:type VII secretion protein EccE